MKKIIKHMKKISIVNRGMNSVIWSHVLEYCGYCPRMTGNYEITSKQIKESKYTWSGKKSQFEPRLLCKQDTKECRPNIFKQYGLNILSIKNGTYLLTHDNIYVTLKNLEVPLKVILKHNSSILQIGDSETSLLDNLRYSGVLEDEIGEKILYGPLLGGRHRCHFTTIFGGKELIIDGSQYETDGCFETENKICIIEVKSKYVKSFNIRQLYYPYRVIYDKIGNTKDIMCLFIYMDKKKIVHIFKYKWKNPKIMMDIECTGYNTYILK